jgi:transposase, IS5 family
MASEAGMVGRQPGFWDVEERLRELSAQGDPLEKLTATVDFQIFRTDLEAALGVRDRSKGGRPPFDAVLKFRMLVLQAMHGLSLAQTEYLVADRLSWMRFCGLGPGDTVPDANTLWDFREALIAAGALDNLFARLDRAITEAGYLPMAGQILDATLVAAPRQRNTDAEKARIKAGESADEIWPDEPAKARQKDVDARWTMKFSKAKPAADGTPQLDIAVPSFGYKSHISIDRRHGIIRRQKVTDAAAHDGARLREGLIDPNNTGSEVWADSAYRSAENERFLQAAGKTSRIHRRKPKGKPMPERTARANAAKSAIRAHVEHPFAHQKGPMRLVVRTIGLARASATVMFANMAYNMKRWCWLERRSLPA